MFIPNKTYQALRTAMVGVVAVLVIVIVGQSVQHASTTKTTRALVDSLGVQLDTQASNTRQSFHSAGAWQHEMEQRFSSLEALVNQQGQTLTELQGFATSTRVSVEKLLRNECTPETAIYVLTRDMVAVCRTLGTLPPE